MLLKRGAEDDDIVDVHKADFPVETLKYTCHQSGEGAGCVYKPKTHALALVQTIVSNESGVGARVRVNWHLPISRLEI